MVTVNLHCQLDSVSNHLGDVNNVNIVNIDVNNYLGISLQHVCLVTSFLGSRNGPYWGHQGN